MPSTDVTAPAGAMTVRETFGGTEIVSQGDLNASAAAAAAKAEIEGAIIAAHKWTRNENQFREDILHASRRPGFAAVALFAKPVGRVKDKVTGDWVDNVVVDFSVRFVEAALKYYQNVSVSQRVIYADDQIVKVLVAVWDLQNLVIYSREAIIPKTVERKKLGTDREHIGTRRNSYGELVYILAATDDEVRNKIGAEVSKLLRDQGKKLLPRDVLDEARAIIDDVNSKEDAKDPDAAKKKVLDRFAAQGVSAVELEAYLGRSPDVLTLKDIAELTVLFNGLAEGSFTWAEVMATKATPAEGAPEPPAGSKSAKLRDKILKARDAVTKKPEEPQQS